MYKKILRTILFLLFAVLIFFQKSLVFNPYDVKFFGYKMNFGDYINNFYFKYFFEKNYDPLYVWNDKVFLEYDEHCYTNNENCLIFSHQQTYSDYIWLSSIQYIGSVVDSAKARYLYPMLDNLTNLNPYWDYPYYFGQLLIPVQKGNSYLSSDQINDSWNEALLLGEKGIKYNCNSDKISKILALSDKDFYRIITEKGQDWKELKDPCDGYELSSYLAFNYFYYKGDWKNAANNYKLASFQTDAPGIFTSMVAVVSGRAGQHIKSMEIWFAKFLVLQDNLLNTTSDDEKTLYATQAQEALKRSLFEYQLNSLQEINQNNPKSLQCEHDYDCLVKKGLLRAYFDSQQYLCSSYDYSNIDVGNISNINENEEGYENKLKCLLLAFGIKLGYINLNSGAMQYPLNKENKENEWFVFGWDDDMQDWWIKLIYLDNK